MKISSEWTAANADGGGWEWPVVVFRAQTTVVRRRPASTDVVAVGERLRATIGGDTSRNGTVSAQWKLNELDKRA